jgi:hypothetical protein
MKNREMNREKLLVQLQTFLINLNIIKKGQKVWELTWGVDDEFEKGGKFLSVGITRSGSLGKDKKITQPSVQKHANSLQ